MSQEICSQNPQKVIPYLTEIKETTLSIEKLMQYIRSTIIQNEKDRTAMIRTFRNDLSKKYNELNISLNNMFQYYPSGTVESEESQSFISNKQYFNLKAQMDDQNREQQGSQEINSEESSRQLSQSGEQLSLLSIPPISLTQQQTECIKQQQKNRYKKLQVFLLQKLEQIKKRQLEDPDEHNNKQMNFPQISKPTIIPPREQRWIKVFESVLRSRQLCYSTKKQILECENLAIYQSQAITSLFKDTNMVIRRNSTKQSILNLSIYPNILIGDFYRNQLRKVKVTSHINLSYLILAFNHLDSFCLPSIPNLIWLDLVGNQIKKIDLSKYPNLLVLLLGSNLLHSVDAKGCKQLMVLQLQSNLLQDLQLFWNPLRMGRCKFNNQRSKLCKITVQMQKLYVFEEIKFIKQFDQSSNNMDQQMNCRYQISGSYLLKVV